MKNILFLLFTCSLFLAASCNKNDDTLDEPHSTLRCKINGEDWEPGGGSSFTISPFDLEYYSDTGGLELVASNNTNEVPFKGAIHFIARNVSLGMNPLIDNESSFYHLQNSANVQECKYYFDLDSTYDNHISIIDIDTINYFMEATFEFAAINECQDTIRVTEGFFDLNYTF